MLLRRGRRNYAKNSNFENFESALYPTSGSMPITKFIQSDLVTIFYVISFISLPLGLGKLVMSGPFRILNKFLIEK